MLTTTYYHFYVLSLNGQKSRKCNESPRLGFRCYCVSSNPKLFKKWTYQFSTRIVRQQFRSNNSLIYYVYLKSRRNYSSISLCFDQSKIVQKVNIPFFYDNCTTTLFHYIIDVLIFKLIQLLPEIPCFATNAKYKNTNKTISRQAKTTGRTSHIVRRSCRSIKG